ncbi:MAG: high-affinity nickel-transporter [Chloroflexi bacterium]|nr:MAG: high-affinity nickel-transporter [Chloroflexota bacterium]
MTFRVTATAVAIAVSVLALTAFALAPPPSAEAHPLGNFTVNRYSRLELYSDAIRVRYVLDMAEIPAFQEMDDIDLDGDGQPSASENEAYLERKSPEILNNLHLTEDGSPLDLRVLTRDISFPEGQAGLRTLRLNLLLETAGASSLGAIQYRDDNYSDRIGWKEIVVQPADGTSLLTSTASMEDISHELTAYPADLLSSPLDVREAHLSFDASGGAAAPAVTAALSAPQKAPSRAGAGFASLIDTDNLTLPVLLLSLLLALGFGAIHALEPGHGKTFLAAYFVGVKGTTRQALSLGLTIAVTHTIGVLAIGLVTLFGSRFILPEKLYPGLSLASALMILALGLRLIAARAGGRRSLRRILAVIRGHGGHEHNHSLAHGHTHGRSGDGAPPWKSLVALGLADGLTPSPSALVVLLAAVSLNRIGLGLLLIVAFSLGLAAVLTLVCLGLIYARRLFDWMSARKDSTAGNPYLGRLAGTIGSGTVLFRAAPIGGAFALIAVGLVLTVRALSQSDLPIL